MDRLVDTQTGIAIRFIKAFDLVEQHRFPPSWNHYPPIIVPSEFFVPGEFSRIAWDYLNRRIGLTWLTPQTKHDAHLGAVED